MLLARGLSVRIGALEILDAVDLEVRPGQVMGMLGPSGAGKTTLFRVLVGEVSALSGEVWLDGEEISKKPLWARARLGLGYVPQSGGILWDLTVAENLSVFERSSRSRPRAAADRAAELGLEGRLEVRARDLSGGEQRRLSLLRAFIASPRYLIIDEPFAGVDPLAAERIVAALRRRAAEGCGILVGDHRARETLAASDLGILLVEGRVAVVLTAEKFAQHPAVAARYMV
jgi:lipopolysaccharide export system ATP-binding protein